MVFKLDGVSDPLDRRAIFLWISRCIQMVGAWHCQLVDDEGLDIVADPQVIMPSANRLLA